jgi:hypothetical protein
MAKIRKTIPQLRFMTLKQISRIIQEYDLGKEGMDYAAHFTLPELYARKAQIEANIMAKTVSKHAKEEKTQPSWQTSQKAANELLQKFRISIESQPMNPMISAPHDIIAYNGISALVKVALGSPTHHSESIDTVQEIKNIILTWRRAA